MNTTFNKSDHAKFTAIIFIISLVIFTISLFPGVFFVRGAIDLLGAAGIANPTPADPSPANSLVFSVFESGLSIVSGAVSIISAVYGIQLGRAEFAKLKTKQIDREMQMQEIEKLRLELELEKQIEKKRQQKKRSSKPAKSTQRKQKQ